MHPWIVAAPSEPHSDPTIFQQADELRAILNLTKIYSLSPMCTRDMPDSFRYHIRPAKSSDIQQVTALAIEGLDSDDLFNYNFPHRKEFPDDCHFAWYRIFESWLYIPRTQFLVAEEMPGLLDENDNDNRDFASDSSQPVATSKPAILAFAKWDFRYADKLPSPPGTIPDSWSTWLACA